MPPWEGYDEPYHFAALQHVASGQGLPHADTPISLEVQNSLHLLPLPWELQFQSIPPPLITYDEFWKLTPLERKQRFDAVRALAPGQASQPATEPIENYESQQAPLYYWMFAVPLGWISTLPLLSRLYLLRMLNVVLASAAIPLTYWIAKRVTNSNRQAIGISAVIVLLPELMINVARIGNESFALVCYTTMLAAAMLAVRKPAAWGAWLLLGATLGVGLLIKAYFLTAIPAVFLLAGIAGWSDRDGSGRERPILAIGIRCFGALAAAIAIAGDWYFRVHAASGSWSGQGDDAALRQVSLLQKLSAIPHVNWKSGVLSVLISHIWFGGWSFLLVPRVLYMTGLLVIVVAIAGVVFRMYQGRDANGEISGVQVLAAFYVCFWSGLAYHVLITFLNQGVSASTGWYLYATVAAEGVLLVWGLEACIPAHVVLPLLTLAVAILDLYGTHALLMPYYTGLTVHHGGAVSPALIQTIRHLPDIFARLA